MVFHGMLYSKIYVARLKSDQERWSSTCTKNVNRSRKKKKN